MNNKHIFGRVPESITFGYKLLQIPTLQEMGIPMSGISFVKLNEGLSKYLPDPSSCWIKRGDPLLTYNFRFFQNEKKNPLSFLFDDPIRHQVFEIYSPVSGLLLATRQEETLSFIGSLQYQSCNEQALPIILIPNDEPAPSFDNFYAYDEIAQHLSNYFGLIPIRQHSKTSSERLRDYIERSGDGFEHYLKCLNVIRERNSEKYRTYEIKEISTEDREIISNIQNLRGKDLHLRDKLVHIARKYGESI